MWDHLDFYIMLIWAPSYSNRQIQSAITHNKWQIQSAITNAAQTAIRGHVLIGHVYRARWKKYVTPEVNDFQELIGNWESANRESN